MPTKNTPSKRGSRDAMARLQASGSSGPAAVMSSNIPSPTQWNEGPEPVLSQEEASPDQRADIEREQRVGEERIAHPKLSRHRPAEIAGQQDRTQDRSSGGGVRDHADQQDDPDQRHGTL